MTTHFKGNKPEQHVERQSQHPKELIEALHAAQGRDGYLSRELLGRLAEDFRLPPSLVYGVASFYHAFRLEPRGEHHCTVCTGTSCHIRGGTELLRNLEQHYDLLCGKTAADASLSLDTVRCLGVCGLAPLALLDEHIISGDSPSEIIKKIILALEPPKKP